MAFVAQSVVYVVEPDGAPRKLESAFVEQVRERSRRIAQGQGWKTEKSDSFLSGAALWGAGGLPDPSALRVSTCGLAAGGNPGELVYCLDTGAVTGAFRFDVGGGEERRLFHGNQQAVEDVAAERDGARFACSVRCDDGTSDVALFGGESALPRPVTAGDSIDQAPSFVPGRSALLFQSAGMGRDRLGSPVGPGAFALHELDLETGELVALAEDPRFDFLSPRKDAAGVLYSLRRPYQPLHQVSRWRALADAVLFPFRVLRGVFGWLYYFTFVYSGRRLTSAGGLPWEGPKLRDLVVWGRRIDVEKAARRRRFRRDDAPPLVPADWELVRHDGSGGLHVIARHVVAFDLAPDGSVLVSNGSAIDRIEPDGKRERVCKATGIERVAALG